MNNKDRISGKKHLGFNPYLPSWEYIPDGEPHVFGDKVYVYGSHDFFNGYEFCPGDYMCYWAPVGDLTDWHCSGVIYGRCDDPRNPNGESALYAPDVTQGPDGKFYLYYCLNREPVVSVAVCDRPDGRYHFLGYVRHADGTPLGEKAGDEFQFDPGVLTEGQMTYLYTGFCPEAMQERHGAMCTILGPDMLTIASEEDTENHAFSGAALAESTPDGISDGKSQFVDTTWESGKWSREEPVRFVVPSKPYSAGTGFADHPFFEASSIRKVGDTYYFVYSSIWNHELCYATSDRPTGGFTYRGVIISNIDKGISSYKNADQPMGYRDNNHGGFACINGHYYQFYHRHTNNYSFSRQACLEPIEISADGSIPQVEMTSCGPNGGPLPGKGYYPAYIACNVYRPETIAVGGGYPGVKKNPGNPYITQEGKDGDQLPGYVENLMDGALVGFKYFACENTWISRIPIRGRFPENGCLEIALSPYGPAVGRIKVGDTYTFRDQWAWYETDIPIPDGKQAIYFRMKGPGRISLGGFELAEQELRKG